MTNGDEMLESAQSRKGELAAPDLDPRPRRKVAVLTCMDTRLEVERILGISRGDAHIIRNAGGLVTDDAIRSLSISQRLLGTEEIIVVMHEDCGLQGTTEEALASALAANGKPPAWSVGAFKDLEKTLEESLRQLRLSAHLVTRHAIRGFVFDPATGNLHEVCLEDESSPASS
ncbi:MAG: beta-class carbonic anhydrase [Solirubrobacterales bacterium]